jgi:disulfide bond formation protein DsbB
MAAAAEQHKAAAGLTDLDKARLLALAVPAALLGGALGSQYIGGLYPCEMCHWQRWGHYAAVAFAILSFIVRRQPSLSRLLVWLAAAGILASGLIGVYHAGVEAGLFEGFTQCTASSAAGSAADILSDIMARPMIRCNDVQWSFLGISMAGWNAILSIGFVLVILWLLLKTNPRRT